MVDGVCLISGTAHRERDSTTGLYVVAPSFRRHILSVLLFDLRERILHWIHEDSFYRWSCLRGKRIFRRYEGTLRWRSHGCGMLSTGGGSASGRPIGTGRETPELLARFDWPLPLLLLLARSLTTARMSVVSRSIGSPVTRGKRED